MTNAQFTRLAMPVSAEDHISGAENAPITLVEYADYQCPYCRSADIAIRQVRQAVGDRVRFVFRNFPLTETHEYALQAAAAAEAAALQGKFWEMHDLLFKNQRALDEESLVRYAEQIGLDIDRFIADIQGDAVIERIRRDLDSGERSDVDSTPSFYINGQKYEGSWEPDDLLSALSATG
jgi:protein-disulfide isomerase